MSGEKERGDNNTTHGGGGGQHSGGQQSANWDRQKEGTDHQSPEQQKQHSTEHDHDPHPVTSEPGSEAAEPSPGG
jgi:hypothetical protein